MTSKEALREIARHERRFEKLGFKNGIMLAKSYPPAKGCPEGGSMRGARDYYTEMLEWQGKVAAAAKSHKAAKAKLEELVIAHRGENKRNPELERIRRIVKSGERMVRKENVARLRFEEKVKRLATIPVE